PRRDGALLAQTLLLRGGEHAAGEGGQRRALGQQQEFCCRRDMGQRPFGGVRGIRCRRRRRGGLGNVLGGGKRGDGGGYFRVSAAIGAQERERLQPRPGGVVAGTLEGCGVGAGERRQHA